MADKPQDKQLEQSHERPQEKPAAAVAVKSIEELQREALELQNEQLHDDIEQRRLRKASRKLQHETNEATLSEGRAVERRVQRNCNHKKGGKGDDLANNKGNDPNYAMADQQMPNGDMWRTCTRCFSTWKPGDTAKAHASGMSYEEAMKLPTDNSPCGSVQFRYPERRVAAEAAAE